MASQAPASVTQRLYFPHGTSGSVCRETASLKKEQPSLKIQHGSSVHFHLIRSKTAAVCVRTQEPFLKPLLNFSLSDERRCVKLQLSCI